VKGLHGLHVYANEHWLECLMKSSTPDKGIDETSTLYTVSMQLSRQLSATMEANEESNSPSEVISSPLGSLLQNLQQQPDLFALAMTALKQRSRKGGKVLSASTDNQGLYL